MSNRLHTFTRWPDDPERRIELARLELEFCRILEKHDMKCHTVAQIRYFANQALGLAKLEMGELEL